MPKTIPVRLDKDNHKRHECADETQPWDSQSLPCSMASLPCLQTSRQEREAPEFTKLDSIARKILAFFALISFPKVIVGLLLWQHDIKQITLLIKWLHVKLLPSCKRGGTYIAVEWMNSFIQEPSVWWLIGPPTWGKCWSPPVLRWFLSPDTLEFLCSLTFLILSVFPSTPCFLSMDYWCIVVKWCLWQETWGDRWKAHGLKSHQPRLKFGRFLAGSLGKIT